MMLRFAPAIAGLTLVGCAMDTAGRAPDDEATVRPARGGDWESIEKAANSNLAAMSCQEAQLSCVAAAGLNALDQIRCATDFTECVADAAGTTIDCSLVAPECLATEALTLDVSGVVDCQQEVVDCAADAVNDVTGVDLEPAFTPVHEIADELAEGVEDAIDDLIEIDVNNCAAEHVECILGARLRPSAQLDCAEDFLGCAGEAVGDVLGCTVDSVGCFGEGVVELDVSEVVDCQQEVVDCALDSVGDITGVTVHVDPIHEIADELADVADEVVDGVGDAVEETVDCSVQATACLVDARVNFFKVRECRIDFVDCESEAVDGVLDPEDVDCDGVYSECRKNGGGIFACARERAECEGG